MSWAEIDSIQKQNNNSLCGMYSPRQLEYWGMEVPQSNTYKYISATALMLLLTVSTNSFGQSISSPDSISKTIVKGLVTGRYSGEIDTLQYTSIWLKNSKIGTVTDENGRYQLDITNFIDPLQKPTLVFSYVGFTTLELQLNPDSKGEIVFDAQLEESIDMDIVYYASKPTLWQKINWRFKRLLHHKEK